MSVAGKLVVIAGAGSASGHAATWALAEAGARVVAVGRDADKLVTLREVAGPLLATEVCDLTDEADVSALASRVHEKFGPVDGVLHLVGGWRGGGGLAGQTEQDYRALEASLTALRHVSRAFYGDLIASEAGRLAIVSSTAVERPLAGGANYAAVKAASEAWVRAVAQGFSKDARSRDFARDDNGDPTAVARDDNGDPTAVARDDQTAAAVIFRVKTLAGLEDHLAASFVELWDKPASEINDTSVGLAHNGQL